MLTSHFHGVTPTVEFMQNMAIDETGTKCPNVLSDAYQYLAAAQNTGNAPNSEVTWLDFEQIKDVLASGTPLHLGVVYGDFGDYRCDNGWSSGHQVVVVGYSEPRSMWVIHDPLCQDANTGAYREIPSQVFRNAVMDASGGHSGAWVLIVK